MASEYELQVLETPGKMAQRAAQLFCDVVLEAVRERDKAFVALSGGSTPKLLHECLLVEQLKSEIPWHHLHFFVSDERCVPLASKESNFGNAMRELFAHVDVPGSQLHAVRDQDKDPVKAALEYEREIRAAVPLVDGLPRFDLVFLGMGPDGHTASLFPETEALGETDRLVVANHIPKLGVDRITFTYSLINHAAKVVFLVAGAEKANVLGEILKGEAGYPAAQVRPDKGKLLWLVDAAASGRLSPAGRTASPD